MSSFTVYILLISTILDSEKQKNSGKTELVIGVNAGPGPPPSWGESTSSAAWQDRRLKLWPLGHLWWKERRPSCWPPSGDCWLPDRWKSKFISFTFFVTNGSDFFIGMEEGVSYLIWQFLAKQNSFYRVSGTIACASCMQMRKEQRHFAHHPSLQRLTCCTAWPTVHSVFQTEEGNNRMLCALDQLALR